MEKDCKRGNEPALRKLPRRLEGVFHKHRDGHGADPAGDRCNGGAARGDFREIDIAGEAVAGFFGGVRNTIDADVDDDRTGFHPIRLDHFRATYRGDQDVGAAADGG